ncbi:hypothetical protein SAMN05216332_11611 [Nitrosospira briensis]|nr:hypothetical protein SAMN05216332_11611 [Nitrosospira briensis]
MQAVVSEQVAKMEAVWKQKITEELALRRQEQTLDRALSAFKGHARSRKLQIPGYDDAGRKWKALTEGLRKAVENFNRLPKEGQGAALAKMREKQNFRSFAVHLAGGQLKKLCYGSIR